MFALLRTFMNQCGILGSSSHVTLAVVGRRPPCGELRHELRATRVVSCSAAAGRPARRPLGTFQFESDMRGLMRGGGRAAGAAALGKCALHLCVCDNPWRA